MKIRFYLLFFVMFLAFQVTYAQKFPPRIAPHIDTVSLDIPQVKTSDFLNQDKPMHPFLPSWKNPVVQQDPEVILRNILSNPIRRPNDTNFPIVIPTLRPESEINIPGIWKSKKMPRIERDLSKGNLDRDIHLNFTLAPEEIIRSIREEAQINCKLFDSSKEKEVKVNLLLLKSLSFDSLSEVTHKYYTQIIMMKDFRYKLENIKEYLIAYIHFSKCTHAYLQKSNIQHPFLNNEYINCIDDYFTKWPFALSIINECVSKNKGVLLEESIEKIDSVNAWQAKNRQEEISQSMDLWRTYSKDKKVEWFISYYFTNPLEKRLKNKNISFDKFNDKPIKFPGIHSNINTQELFRKEPFQVASFTLPKSENNIGTLEEILYNLEHKKISPSFNITDINPNTPNSFFNAFKTGDPAFENVNELFKRHYPNYVDPASAYLLDNFSLKTFHPIDTVNNLLNVLTITHDSINHALTRYEKVFDELRFSSFMYLKNELLIRNDSLRVFKKKLENLDLELHSIKEKISKLEDEFRNISAKKLKMLDDSLFLFKKMEKYNAKRNEIKNYQEQKNDLILELDKIQFVCATDGAIEKCKHLPLKQQYYDRRIAVRKRIELINELIFKKFDEQLALFESIRKLRENYNKNKINLIHEYIKTLTELENSKYKQKKIPVLMADVEILINHLELITSRLYEIVSRIQLEQTTYYFKNY
jgi:hypothetical protein